MVQGGRDLTVSSVTVMGLGGAERGIPSHLIILTPKLELIGVNQCELGEGLITGTEASPRAKLPNISRRVSWYKDAVINSFILQLTIYGVFCGDHSNYSDGL